MEIVHQPVHQRVGEGVRRDGGGQESGQGDGDLDGGEEIVGGLHELEQRARLFVALLGLMAQLGLRQRDDGDLRRGEKGVDGDKYDQDQYFGQWVVQGGITS